MTPGTFERGVLAVCTVVVGPAGPGDGDVPAPVAAAISGDPHGRGGAELVAVADRARVAGRPAA
ncbi:MAG: hypothetical protein WAL13_04145, partial [Trebonia sp.]